MGLSKIIKAKVPKLPKGLEDKDLKKLVPRLEKELAAFQKSADALLDEFNTMIGTAIEVQNATIDRYSDKKGDPAQAKLASEFWQSYEKFYAVICDI